MTTPRVTIELSGIPEAMIDTEAALSSGMTDHVNIQITRSNERSVTMLAQLPAERIEELLAFLRLDAKRTA